MSFETCRICLITKSGSKYEFRNIFDNNGFFNGKAVKFADAIMDCAPIRITENDELPENICLECIENLKTSYLFRQTCLESDYKLNLQLHLKNDSIKVETSSAEGDDFVRTKISSDNGENLNFKILKEEGIEEESSEYEINNYQVNNDDSVIEKIVCHLTSTISNNGFDEKTENCDKDCKINYHNNSDLLNCETCKLNFKNKMKYDKHLEIHQGSRPFVCEYCGVTFKRTSHLNAHRTIHDDFPNFNCEICSKKCITQRQLRIHNRKYHPVEYRAKQILKLSEFTCNYCKYPFDSKSLLNQHTLDRVCKKKAKRINGPFICAICNKKFQSHPSLKNHLRIHSGERPFVCEVCGKSFKQEAHLSIHSKGFHLGEKPFMCEICSKKYTTNSGLKKHLSSNHGISKPKIVTIKREREPTVKYTCKVCSKTYKRHFDYEQHIRIHTGESPYMCEKCGTTFKQATQLRLHKLTHIGMKPHSCVVCSKAFSTKAELRVHSIAHTDEHPHKCTMCDQRFKYRITAWRHMMYHTGERPHKCTICGKAFYEAQPLRSHMRVHTGERPNQCKICYKSFKEKTHLKTHMKVHKAEKAE